MKNMFVCVCVCEVFYLYVTSAFDLEIIRLGNGTCLGRYTSLSVQSDCQLLSVTTTRHVMGNALVFHVMSIAAAPRSSHAVII